MHAPIVTKNSQGFSLVEALIAAAILGGGVLAAAVMISRSTIQDSRAYHLTQAALMAEEYIEQHITAQYDRDEFKTQIKDVTNQTITTNQTINGVEYLMECVVIDSEYNEMFKETDKKCREMNCTVTWNNKGIAAQVENIYVFCPKY